MNKYHHHPHKYHSDHNIIIIITIEHEATLALMASRQQDKRDNSTSVTAIAAVIVIVEILTARWQIIRFTDFQWKVIPISENTQTIMLCFPYQVITIPWAFCIRRPHHKWWLTIACHSETLCNHRKDDTITTSSCLLHPLGENGVKPNTIRS